MLLRGGSVMAGYLDDPDETAKALSPDGWLRTGDLGTLDDAGRVRIVGRVKDMFIVGGFNAYPAEIENALLRHPDVQQAAVIGIPDERLGEVGMAFVVASRPSRVTSSLAWSRSEMANYKVPRAVEIVDELPLNATGKVMKECAACQRATPAARAAEGGPTRDALHRRARRASRRWRACGWWSSASGSPRPGRRAAGGLGCRRHQGGAATWRSDAQRVRLARDRRRTSPTRPSPRTTAASGAWCSTCATRPRRRRPRAAARRRPTSS